MDRISSLQFFVRVVQCGSFSQAAREMGVGQPAVSKQIASLERRLGAQLVNRTSRGLRPTPAGAQFYDDAVRMLGDLDEAETRVATSQGRPSGMVRVALPSMMTAQIIVPNLADFFERFPDISIQFTASERFADLVRDGFDLAIRVGELADSGLLARKIGLMEIATVASPVYLSRYGVPATPSELVDHMLVANRHSGAVNNWHFTDAGRDITIPVTGRLGCNDPADVQAAAIAGLGIAQSARGLFDEALNAGLLTEVLVNFAPAALPIHTLYGSPRIPQRVRVVSEFIAQCVNRHADLRLPDGAIPKWNGS